MFNMASMTSKRQFQVLWKTYMKDEANTVEKSPEYLFILSIYIYVCFCNKFWSQIKGQIVPKQC